MLDTINNIRAVIIHEENDKPVDIVNIIVYTLITLVIFILMMTTVTTTATPHPTGTIRHKDLDRFCRLRISVIIVRYQRNTTCRTFTRLS